MQTPRTLASDVDVFSWTHDAAPDIVREFDWEDAESRTPAWLTTAVVPSAALIAASTVALRVTLF
jgi:hypothetical protein